MNNPFSLVERVGFHEFFTELYPHFKHFSRFTIAKDCMKLYFCERTCLKTYSGKINSRIAFMIEWGIEKKMSAITMDNASLDNVEIDCERWLNYGMCIYCTYPKYG